MPSTAAFAIVLALGVSTLMLGSSMPATAQFSGTPKEQAACRPDVARFCKGLTGDSDEVFVECLVKNAPQVSARCRKVLQDHGKLPK
jgi:hypothetical protein